MGYHPRIECKKMATFQTTRSRNSELWFVNNNDLTSAILGYAAKYSNRYGVKLYAFSIEGNHIQFPAHFPKCNRSSFLRDFNSSVARAIPRYQRNYPGGTFWARRYSAEYLPGRDDIEEQFFYTVLQPVKDGLVDDIKDCPWYNCFEDAIKGIERQFKTVKWKEYNDAKRWNPDVKIRDYIEIQTLKFERLPGYKKYSTANYIKLMREKLKERTRCLVESRLGTPCLGREKLLRIKPGSLPLNTKTSTRYDHRPRVLSVDNERRAKGKAWYFSIYFDYKKASQLYRKGHLNVKFPKGTYKPPLFTVCREGTMVD